MSYFNLLPIEVNTQIHSYLDENSIFRLYEIFNLSIDYHYLISKFHKDKYNPNVIKYNTATIYHDLHFPRYADADVDSDILVYKMETERYLMMYGYRYPNSEKIAQIDDLDIFIKYEDKLVGIWYTIAEYLKCHSYNIVKYLME